MASPKVDPVDPTVADPTVADPSVVNTVTVKLSSFWASNPKAWFAHSDAQFAVRSVTQSLTKFYYCVSVLTEEVASQILDLIADPPSSDPYGALRKRLCDTYGLNPYQRFEAFLSLPFSADMKPSHLMNKMVALLPTGETPGFLFRGHFLRRLPADIRAHLLQDNDSDCRTLSLKADQLWQSNAASGVCSLNPSTFSEEVNALRGRSSSKQVRDRASTPAASSRRSRQQSPSSSPSSMCWYHRKHGEEAQRCRPPCSYVPGN